MLSKNLLFGLISGAVVVAGGVTAPIISSNNHFKKGWSAQENGDMQTAIQEYEKSKKADAYFQLGELYALQMDSDSTAAHKSFAAYQKSYDKGIKEAAFPLAKAYLMGEGVKQDAKKGFAMAKEAADNEDAPSCMLVGYCYENGIGTIRDEQKAFDYYRHSATQDNPNGLFYLACCYLNGTGVARDTQKGQELMKEGALLGSEDAINFLEQQERERQRQIAEQKRIREEQQRAYKEQMITCPKCHGYGYYYDRGLHKDVTCIVCWGKGRCTRAIADDYDEIPFW